MEELTKIEIFYVNLFMLVIAVTYITSFYIVIKTFQKLRSNNRYIKVLERKIKEGD